MKLQKRTKQKSAAAPRARIGKDAKGSFAQRALNWKKWAKSPFFTIQKSAAPLNRKKSASRFFIHRGGSLFTASLLCIALLFPQCANVKGIFTDNDSTASTPPPDPTQCELDAEEQGLSFAGGGGTEEAPFEVSSAGELENIGQLLYCNYVLTQNITLSGNWTPLGAESPCDGGNDDACFQGKLDGNGKMISDLTVNITGDYGGLFGYTGEHAETRSVGLSGVNIMAGDNTGGLVGYNNGSISNSYSTGTVSSTTGHSIGGLVGSNDGSISSSYSTVTADSAINGVGGLVGANNGTISNSYATGASSGQNNVGGLAGQNDSGGNISNSYAIGTAAATSVLPAETGGLVGYNNGTISNSYAAGMVSSAAFSPTELGGLVGEDAASSGSFSGTNYFADDAGGSDGIGASVGSSCDVAVCVQAMGGDDAARAAWLRDTLDETDDIGLNWDEQLDADGNAVWGNLNASGFPCLKNMPAGAPSC